MRGNLTGLFLTYLSIFNLLNLLVGLTRYVMVSFNYPDIRLYSETLCILHHNIVLFLHLGVNWTILAVAVCKMAYVIVPNTLKNLPQSFVHVVVITMCMYGFASISITNDVLIDYDEFTSFGLEKCEVDQMTVLAYAQMTLTFALPEVLLFAVNITTIRIYYKIWTNATPREQKMVRGQG
ncbi:hypothetical protein PoB_005625500 [Plakobranchus ocellatus]|uniref:G-protein coupled receptors family 1 profile domain-containing protein n=1 Tax=Plakobranchus ocellatus TaxID=259542 RepID=A0AAV4CDK9_9GAST|nr:hypothetical protein PoB_005625500 [Plakobranchus ocellatus]